MADEKTLDDLFYDTLRDVYYAENQLVKALPKMARAAQDPMLKQGFETHAQETEGHVERLERVFEILGRPARGKTCDAILGILEEGKSIMDEYKGAIALDAGLIAAGQAAEHYEITAYGTCIAWAEALELSEVAEILNKTLAEEKAADEKLTAIAESGINEAATAGESEEGEMEDDEEERSSMSSRSQEAGMSAKPAGGRSNGRGDKYGARPR